MNCFTVLFWKRLWHRRSEDSFTEEEFPDRVSDIVMRRMYERHPHHSWSQIQKLFPEEITRERTRVSLHYRQYIYPARLFLRVITRWFPYLR